MKGLVIWILADEGSDEAVLDELGTEIKDRGGRVEVFHSEAVESLGMEENYRAKAVACAMLASHGVVVIASGRSGSGIVPGEKLAVREVSEEQLRDGRVRTGFMRDLELAGLVPPPKYDVHPDEEKEILKRLQDLGYLEE
ncbi:MAG: hypothetical protein JXA64_01815 [Candidatus Fermentibacteraceae bacterium]|nr:hypothetical protein [Candidatus Fermentibacteraceae bacterium]MBN2607823.1 hypothetical protein [Candidatus Fermentibacteraceae bacterium]